MDRKKYDNSQAYKINGHCKATPSAKVRRGAKVRRTPKLLFTKEIRCLYTIMLMSTFWFTEALPMAVTSLLPLVLYPILGVGKAKDVTKDYMKDPLFLFIGGYMLAIAVENCNLHKRLALGTLVMIGSDIKRILASLMLSTGFLSMWANNAACTAMMLPILRAILLEIIKDNRLRSSATAKPAIDEYNNNEVDIENKNEKIEKQAPTKLADMNLTEDEQKICKIMLLGTCYAANIGGIATLTGTPPNIIVFGMIEASYGTHTGLTYATWMLAATPLAVLNLILAWILLQIFFVGINYKEKVVALLFSILILLWITRSPKVVTGWGDIFPKE
uniref:Uncharacterized protein n=1 Tax=Romanomermis culicivorax TaxID=13658 RepID=A0A915HYN1_ROMCU